MMSVIEDLKFEKNSDSLGWICNGSRVCLSLKKVVQALLDDEKDLVVVLHGSEKISVFDCGGTELLKFDEPGEGFQFYYLVRHPDLGVAVVCLSPESVDGWRDWHFGIDIKNRTLFRYCPAY